MSTIIDLNSHRAPKAIDTRPVRHISCADTAKLVRAALKEAFPGQKFSVTSDTYSGGASIDIKWIDGPTANEVERVVNKFEGADFDGMQDLKTYHSSTLNGERVYFGADFIHTNRDYSADFLLACAEKIAEQWGCPMPEVKTNTYTYRGKTYTSVWISRDGEALDMNAHPLDRTAGDKALQLAATTSAYKRP